MESAKALDKNGIVLIDKNGKPIITKVKRVYKTTCKTSGYLNIFTLKL